MKLTLLAALAAAIFSCTVFAQTPTATPTVSPTSTPRCDCTYYPFERRCYDTCNAKYLAIASEPNLREIFGLPPEFAHTISQIPPNSRPHSVQGYSSLLPEPVFTALEFRIQLL